MSEESKPKHAGGRPTLYNEKLATRICKLIAKTPKGVKYLCKKYEWMPKYRTVLDWIHDNKEFSRLYARAKKRQCDVYAEETILISDKAEKKLTKVEEKKSTAFASIVKLQVDSRHWYVERLNTKKYGQKQFVKSENKNDNKNTDVNGEEVKNKLLEAIEKKLAPVVPAAANEENK